MHIAINREDMAFMWAHPDMQVLLDMAHLESDCAVHVVSLENPSYYRPFLDFTDLELKLLYENTTGEKYTGFDRNVLEAVAWGLAVRLPQLEVDRVLLNFQAQQVDEEYAGCYRYTPGSKEPRLEENLFGVLALRVGRSLEQERLAALGELLPAKAPVREFAAPTGDDRAAARSSTPRAARPAGIAAPPRGSTRETIWACADRMWDEAGKPTAPSAVLALRKKMMDQLEQEGVKRTSSSNELGQWQKVRINQQQV